ncbi:MAG: hypothetical protein GXO77_09505 [Calditrichaeota bacterium]|nr:hypothetical protein [Calditrichota bacterium]
MLANKNNLYLILIFLFVLQFSQLSAQLRVAIGNFENQTDEVLLDSWERNLPDYLGVELGETSSIVLLERNRLNEIFKEMNLVLSGFVEDSSLVEKIGKLAGADVLISGVLTKVENHYVILAHLTRVKTGEVWVERVEAPDNKNFRKMVKLLGNNIRFRLTGEGSYRTSQSLNRYPTSYFLGAAVLSGIAAASLFNNYRTAYDDYHNTSDLDKFDTFYDKANRLHKWSNAMFFIAGSSLLGAAVCWIKNITRSDLKAGSDKSVTFKQKFYWKPGEVKFALTIHF